MGDAELQSHKRKADSIDFIPNDTTYAAITLNRKSVKTNSSSTPYGFSDKMVEASPNVDVRPSGMSLGLLSEQSACESRGNATTALEARAGSGMRSDKPLGEPTAVEGESANEAGVDGDGSTTSKTPQISKQGPCSLPKIERSVPSSESGVSNGSSPTAHRTETGNSDPTATPPSKSPSNELQRLSAFMAPLEFYLPLDKFKCPWITSRDQNPAWLPPFHVCAEREFIQNYNEQVSQVEVYNPFQRRTFHTESLGTGVVRIEVVGTTGDKVQVTLKNVYHIPALGCNIFCPSTAGSRLNGLAVELETAGSVSHGKEWFALQTCRRDYMVLKGQAVQFDGTPIVRDFAPCREVDPA